MAVKNELLKIINLVNSNKNFKKKTILLHCVSSYPLDIKNCNFYKFHFLKKKFHNVGYSGHLQGNEDAIYALNNGASVIEKHFTINNNLPGRDNKFALNLKQFSELNRLRELYYNFMISKGLDLQKCEVEIFRKHRGRWTKKIKKVSIIISKMSRDGLKSYLKNCRNKLLKILRLFFVIIIAKIIPLIF